MKTKARPFTLEDTYFDLVKAFPLVPIRDDDHLAKAASMIDQLLRMNLDDGETAYLDVLSDLVHAYEEKHHPMPAVSEAALLKHLIEAKGASQAQVARDTGLAASTISEVLSGSRELSKRHIKVLAAYFLVSPAVFLSST